MKPSELTQKPWGEFRQFTHNETTTVKTLTVIPGGELSLQTHDKRSEYWFVLDGDPIITQGDKVFVAHKGDEIFIETGQAHRIAAQDNTAVLLEIAFGDFDENDIIRLEDKYGRD